MYEIDLNAVIPRTRLTFLEVSILESNMYKHKQVDFIARLSNLLRHTEDPVLKNETESLLQKIQDLTPDEFARLRADTEDKSRHALHLPFDYELHTT